MMYNQRLKVVISGSQSLKQLPKEAIATIQRIIQLNAIILIGDCYGTDFLVQTYLQQAGYHQVKVFHIGKSPRNNAGFVTVKIKGSYSERDRIMCSEADFGLAIIQNNSPGTLKNIQRMPHRVKVIRVPVNLP